LRAPEITMHSKHSTEEEKYIAVGDIHGCAKTLEALLKTISDFKDRQFVFIGDYIDRGPDSKGVVDQLLEFSKTQDCIMLRGNHEQMMLDAHETGDMRLWISNGGQATLKSYNAPFNKLDLPGPHFHFYRNTHLFYNTDQYFFAHAGAPPDLTIKQAVNSPETYESFLWSRSHLDARNLAWEKKVVFGHTPRPEPIVKGPMIGIDTGCVYSQMGNYSKLTAIKLPEEEFIFQPCLDSI